MFMRSVVWLPPPLLSPPPHLDEGGPRVRARLLRTRVHAHFTANAPVSSPSLPASSLPRARLSIHVYAAGARAHACMSTGLFSTTTLSQHGMCLIRLHQDLSDVMTRTEMPGSSSALLP